MIAVTEEKTSPADERYGYQFGCDGVVSVRDAMEALGGVSKATIYRRFEEGLLRHGREKGRAVVCRRSLREYLSGLEK